MTVDTQQYYGQTDPTTNGGDWNQIKFVTGQQILLLNTSMPVEVVAVRNIGVNPVGQVDIKILVTQVTGDDKTVDHGIIPNVPYFRLQGGTSAVIIDPEVGDMGMASFCSRDISAVKNARMQAPPGSRRAYDFSDAMYVGGFLNKAPVQYIHFTSDGIVVYSPTKITQNAPEIIFNADIITMNSNIMTMNGNVGVNGNMATVGTLTNNSKDVGSTHHHSGSPTAPNGPVSNTGVPI